MNLFRAIGARSRAVLLSRRKSGGRYLLLFLVMVSGWLLAAEPLPGTHPWEATGDLSTQMVAGMDRWLLRENERLATNRAAYWKRDFSSRAAYEKSINPNRERLRRMIGATDKRVTNGALQELPTDSAVVKSNEPVAFRATQVRWPIFDAVFAEGLWLRSTNLPAVGETRPLIIALPDADQTPEMMAGLAPGVPAPSQFARYLVESGCEVLIPTLVSRSDEFSGNAKLKRFTNQPHREWLYRQSYEMGRHIIGYEVQKVLAAIDAVQGRGRVGVVGYGEGGLIALYAAALDPRVEAAVVSGYFNAREELWKEPIYRNVFGLLREFGDAEIASLIAPRKLIVEFCAVPVVLGPPAARAGRTGAAPGKISPIEFSAFEAEGVRANELTARLPGAPFLQLVYGNEGMSVNYGSSEALSALLAALGTKRIVRLSAAPALEAGISPEESSARQRRTVQDLEQFTQHLKVEAERTGDAKTASLLRSTNDFPARSRTNREFFWREILGKIEAPKGPPNPRTRLLYDRPAWTGYEVMLDVFPDVFAGGVLLVPKDLKPGEQRPVVVCPPGLEGLPEDTITKDPSSSGYKFYRAVAARLVERGFIVYAPHHPARGGDGFSVLQRQANPLGLSLCSFIIAQHEVTTDWLAALPFVDPHRIAFYGLSHGDATGLRVPSVVERYCLAICPADLPDGPHISSESPGNSLLTGEHEWLEWNLVPRFTPTEMAGLLAPRPFMVKRGSDDTEAFQFLKNNLHWPVGENAKAQSPNSN